MGYNFSITDIKRVVDEGRGIIVGGRIQGIFQPQKDEVYLEIFLRNNTKFLLISIENGFNRIYLCDSKKENPQNPFSFQMLLRKYLFNSCITSIEQLNDDRVIRISTPEFNLYAELTGRHANIFLTDNNDKILGSIRENRSQKRPLFTGMRYVPPFRVSLSDKPVIEIPEGSEVSKFYEEFYNKIIYNHRLDTLKRGLVNHLKRKRVHIDSILMKVAIDREKAERFSEYLRYAEALKQNLILKKEKGIAICEYYTEAGKEIISVPIDERLSISENAQRYFNLYKKYKNSLNLIIRREEELKSRRDEITKDLEEINNCNDLKRLEVFSEKIGSGAGVTDGTDQKKDVREFPFAVFFLEGVGRIYSGSDSDENEILTFKYARGNDLWFHIIGYSGSHVVLPVVKDKVPSERQIVTAALLAAARSSAPDGETVEVAYTRVKYVRKAKGGEKGAVILSKEKRLFVKVDKKFPHTLIRLS